MLARLLQGSKRYFVLCILSGILFNACELIVPQILRMTVDSVIDSQPLDAPEFVRIWLDSIGGVAFLRTAIWIPGPSSTCAAGRWTS